MRWYVITQGRDGIVLFLVNRAITKDKWWTTDLSGAMAFRKQSAAEIQAGKLRYKNPQVVSSSEAREMTSSNLCKEIENSEHPFSSKALGQW